MLDGRAVLIIEAELLIALDMQRVLETAGCASVAVARSPEEFAAMADRIVCDLVLLELLHDADAAGLALARRLAAGGTALVLTSPDSRHRRGLPAMPCVPVVTKPFSDAELLAACRAALGARR